MTRVIFRGIAVGLLVLATGCAHNSIFGDGGMRSDQFFGDLGITGDQNGITVESGSRLHKLSILGHNNTITVAENVRIAQIEFWGKGNTVSLPEDMVVRTTEVGTNQIIRRPRELRELSPMYTPLVEPTYAPEPNEPVEEIYIRPPPTSDVGTEEYDWESLEPYEPPTDPNGPVPAEPYPGEPVG